MTVELQCYAPGDGALSFVHTERPFNESDKIATGKNVTRKQIERFLEKKKNEKFKDYLVVEFPGPKPQYRLCAPVLRMTENLLSLNGTIYKYSIDTENFFWKNEGKYTSRNLTITYHLYVEVDGKTLVDDPERELVNISVRGALVFFLNNEKTIVEQHPKQDRTKEVQDAIAKSKSGIRPTLDVDELIRRIESDDSIDLNDVM